MKRGSFEEETEVILWRRGRGQNEFTKLSSRSFFAPYFLQFATLINLSKKMYRWQFSTHANQDFWEIELNEKTKFVLGNSDLDKTFVITNLLVSTELNTSLKLFFCIFLK